MPQERRRSSTRQTVRLNQGKTSWPIEALQTTLLRVRGITISAVALTFDASRHQILAFVGILFPLPDATLLTRLLLRAVSSTRSMATMRKHPCQNAQAWACLLSCVLPPFFDLAPRSNGFARTCGRLGRIDCLSFLFENLCTPNEHCTSLKGSMFDVEKRCQASVDSSSSFLRFKTIEAAEIQYEYRSCLH